MCGMLVLKRIYGIAQSKQSLISSLSYALSHFVCFGSSFLFNTTHLSNHTLITFLPERYTLAPPDNAQASFEGYVLTYWIPTVRVWHIAGKTFKELAKNWAFNSHSNTKFYIIESVRNAFPKATTPIILHLLDDRTLQWTNRMRVGFGLLGEQGAESISNTCKVQSPFIAI